MLSDILGRPAQIGRLVGAPVVLGLSSTTARTAALKAFTAYRLYSVNDCFFLFGTSTVVADSSSHPLKAGISEVFRTDATNIYLAGILVTSTANLYISELEL